MLNKTQPFIPSLADQAHVEAVNDDTIRRAAGLLKAGELVAFPTETVYGLGADAENVAAVAQIYATKGRPDNHPLIVHLAEPDDVYFWTSGVSEKAQRLLHRFAPGPLTLILPRAAHINTAVTGGQDTIGLRIPAHPVAQQLLRAFKEQQNGRGIAAPSANRFGHVSPTTAQHVADDFGGRVAMILDGGETNYGIESIVIALNAEHPVLLRPGSIPLPELEETLGEKLLLPTQAPRDTLPRASGTLPSHYAPYTPAHLVSSQNLIQEYNTLQAKGKRVAILTHGTTLSCPDSAKIILPADATAYAHGLYAALRALDRIGADIILIEAVPDDEAWRAVRDRLKRAATQ
jgi:Sua5/YciO/YrdC/YwlC family protein